jgi:NitT/TauT family transport system ATP-binding protein
MSAFSPQPRAPLTDAQPSPAEPLPSDRAGSGTAIRVEDISMVYTTRRERLLALSGINLDIAEGEFVSLIGPSGCGKSTLLRLIGDLLQPTSGKITVHGKPAPEARQKRDYGMVFQSPVLYDWRTVERNVQLPLELMGVSKKERVERSQELLQLVGLRDFARRYPWELSGGMQQRVSIARALSFRPSILLMDEPFGALDEMTRERLNMELLNLWSQTGTTIVFVTHSIPEAVFLSDRVVIMTPRPGRIEHIVQVDLPRPRGAELREDDRFFHALAEVRSRLYES